MVHIPTRSVVNFSKRSGKKKTVKAVAKRFHRTGSGKLKYWPAGKVHNMLKKSRNYRKSLRKPRYASKTELKTLNKMISGW
jgi:large subunit ribosomal protein L35